MPKVIEGPFKENLAVHNFNQHNPYL